MKQGWQAGKQANFPSGLKSGLVWQTVQALNSDFGDFLRNGTKRAGFGIRTRGGEIGKRRGGPRSPRDARSGLEITPETGIHAIVEKTRGGALEGNDG